MDADTPSTPPIPRPEGGPWPASSSEPPPPTPEATITLPPDPTATPAPEPSPSDAYADLDYGAMLEAFPVPGMTPAELSSVYPAARWTIERFGGQGFAETDGLGNDPMLLRAMGKLGKDLQTYQDAFNRNFPTLPEGTQLRTAPLTGEALDREIDVLLNTYLDGATRRKLELSGVLSSADGRAFVEKVVTARHRLQTGLAGIDKAMPEVNARAEAARDRAALQAIAPGVQGMSEAQFREQSNSLYDQIAAAKEAGQHGTAAALQNQHENLFRARYPGKH